MGNHIPVPVLGLPFNYLKRGQDWAGDSCGMEQSPIDIVPANSQPSDDTMKMQLYLTDHSLTGLKVEDLGNTLQVNGSFSKLVATDVDGDSYEFEAIQFHFHAPAEHTINGKHYDLELHIVHQMTPECASKAKTHRNLAVLAVFFELDSQSLSSPHPFIEGLKLHNVGTDISLNMNDLLSDDLTDGMTFHAYKGSLTTPPCSQNANFYVLEKPLKITKDQLDNFNLRWKDNFNFANGHGNNRPVQPLNGRTVKKSSNCCVMGRSEECFMKMTIQEKEEEKEDVKTPSTTQRRALEDIEYMRDIVFDDLSSVGKHALNNAQEFIETNTFTKKIAM